MEKLQKALDQRMLLNKSKYIKKRRVGNKWVYDYGSKKGLTSQQATSSRCYNDR